MEYASSINAVAMAIHRLDVSGAPVTGASALLVTSKFVRVAWTPEYEVGEEVQQRNADGKQCVYYKQKDILKRVNLEIAICDPQPEIYEMLAGGSLLTSGVDPNVSVDGYAAPEATDELDYGVGVEVWSRRIADGRPVAGAPFWRWVFPWVETKMDGQRALEQGLMGHAFTGQGLGNADFGQGYNDTWTFPTLSAMQYAKAATAPSGIDDFVAVP